MEKLPLDTIGGIMQAIAEINAEGRKQLKKRRQCPATHGPSRNGTIVFCEHDEGHEGDHKGFRKKWPNVAAESSSAATSKEKA